ncbi:MAG: L-glutamate gamma-semialdehyde dehydrogenase [Bacteroidota bacterium]|nr:L-glutamate gamma-semialdehyde dehydrogenase [Bacteroidota bacterium]
MNRPPYRPEQYLDFSDTSIVAQQRAALEKVRSMFGKEYPNIIYGEEVFTDKKVVSINPADISETIGIFQSATQSDAERALQSAWKGFETWKDVPAEQRAEYLFRAADIVRQRRLEINAWMISEAGKNYPEADADTCEAIDFLEFYGREALRYAQPQPLTRIPGEDNSYFYIPLGAGFVVTPWNFPFAILVGTSAAPIAAGNTVVLKPAMETPMMGWIFADIMREVGLPPGVLNFISADPLDVGDFLVQHPKTRFISFTGSMHVGLRINQLAAQPQPEQLWIKRVIAEMGGKDAIIVADDADIDDAVRGTVASAFGFQGQKCSACSRVIVDECIHDEFVTKLVAATQELTIGNPKDNASIGPVSSQKAENKILEYIEIGKTEGKLLVGGKKVPHLNGYYIEPTIFDDVAPTARIAQEEIFGPVLAVIRAKDFNHALEIANGTKYGLTGAVYSTSPGRLERARREFFVGNLYLNRKCTGAIVDVHPFGGFNMSGTDSKAGSRDYLMLFLQGKSVTRKLP